MSDLKYFAANYVAFKDNLTEQEKGSLIKWFKEAPDDQIKSLLITGNYIFEQQAVDEFDKVLGVLLEADFTGLTRTGTAIDLKSMGLGGTLGGGGSATHMAPRTGIVDMNSLINYINKFAEKSHASGVESGVEAGRQAVMQTGVAGLAAAVVAALVVTVAYKAYKRFLSKAARSCKGLSDSEKTSCMNKYKREAMKKQVTDLSKGIQACGKTKNPRVCENKIKTKVVRLQAKLGAL